MNAPTNAVILAVSEDGFDAALSFAVGEARRTHHPLHLVHVLQLPAGRAYEWMRRDLVREGRLTLAAAEQRAAELAGDDVPVTAELVDTGKVVDGLTHHVARASLLVLQHRALPRSGRILGGSIAQSVAGRAGIPVVSVPEDWTPRVGAEPVVTVGVQDPVLAGPLLRIAFEEARARSATLVVLHAWYLASGFDVVVVDKGVRDQYAADLHEELGPVLAPLRAEFHDVRVAVTVQHQTPIEAVLDGAEKSDLLVLGRRHHLLPLGSHLGPVPRAAIAHATCPVLIAPEVAVPVTEDQHSDRRAVIGRVVEAH